jgi:hypothetical protein
MTESPALPPPETPVETAPEPPSSPAAKRDWLAWLSAAGFLILAASLVWVWRHPDIQFPAVAQNDAQQIAALDARMVRLEQQPTPAATDLAPLTGRVTALEQHPVATPAQPVKQPDLAPLEARIAALEQRPTATPTQPAKQPDLAPLDARIAALEQRPIATPTQPVKPPDLAPLEARIAALEAKQAADSQALARIDALSARADALENAQHAVQSDLAHRMDADETRLSTIEHNASQGQAVANRANRTARILAAQLALDTGQKLGDLPGAPPALARFASTAPPTDAGLRQAFPAAARNALAAARPPTDGKPLLDRIWAEAQDLVTIRQGDRVLVGDPTAGVLARARTALDAGDLAGAVAAIGSLNGAPAQAMAGWLADARALLDARNALAEWAAHA